MKKWLMGLLIGLFLAVGVGYHYWFNAQSDKKMVEMRIQAPHQTNFNGEYPEIYPLTIMFDESVAPLELIGKPLTKGIDISPKLAGEWKWESENILSFLPQQDWKTGQSYQINIQPNILLDTYQYPRLSGDFVTPNFEATLAEAEFYQHPTQADIRFATYQIDFSHPVNKGEFERAVGLQLVRKNKDGSLDLIKSLNGQVKFDDKALTAYIKSPIVALANADNQFVELKLDSKKVMADNGGLPLAELSALGNHEARFIPVPTKFSLKADIRLDVVKNQKQVNEQILHFQFNQAVKGAELADNLQIWLLPKGENNQSWKMNEVQPFLVSENEVSFSLLPTEQPYGKMQSVRIDAPEARQLVVKLGKNLTALGGYQAAKDTELLVDVPYYPQHLSFVGQGALLSTQSDHKIMVTAQNLTQATLVVGRVQLAQLRHLASLNQGSFEQPEFAQLKMEDIADFNHHSLYFSDNGQKPSYATVDLSAYKRGIFWLKLSADDEKESWRYQGYHSDDNRDQRADYRLVVLSDLGIIAKRAADGRYQVFVQSIEGGQPLAQVKLEMIAANGKTLAAAQTNAQGVAYFPAFYEKQFNKSERPVMFIAALGEDLSFLPLKRYGDTALLNYQGELNYSRFDIDGVTHQSEKTLNSYVFSDRGIYRAGETVHLGIITKDKKWQNPLQDLPLQLNVFNSRGDKVENRILRIGQFGFNTVDIDLAENAPNGTWLISVNYADQNEETLLGSVQINVQDFQPDTMKLTAHFNQGNSLAWYHPNDLVAQVQLSNLFGTPAQRRLINGTLSGEPTQPRFEAYPDVTFYSERQHIKPWEQQLDSELTDEQGKVEFPLELNQFADNAVQRVIVLLEAFETEKGGGRAVSRGMSALVSAQPFMLGYQTYSELNYLRQHQAANLNIIAVDPHLTQIDTGEVSAVLLERKTLSVLSESASGKLQYQTKPVETELSRQPIRVSAQGLDYALPTENVGNFVLELRNAQNQRLQRIPFNVVGNGAFATALEHNQTLQLRLDKKSYQGGEEIEIAIQAPYTGSGLITIEREQVYAYQWFKTDTQSSVQKIRLPDNFEGGGYVNVQFVRSPNSDDIFSSPLSYAVVPFSAQTQARQFDLQLDTPKKLQAGEKLVVKVRSDRPAKGVIYGVSEGILQVSDYQFINPLNDFFQKPMLEVKTLQLLDLILPSYGKLLQFMQTGGDLGEESAVNKLAEFSNPFQRKSDKPVVFWSDIIELNPNGEVEYTIPPQFNGNLKIMAIALDDEHIATAQGETLVQSDLILTPNVPTVMTPQDQATISLNVANTTAQPQQVKIRLENSPHFSSQQAEQIVELPAKGEKQLNFSITASRELGSATVKFIADYDDKQIERAVEMSVRPLSPAQTWLSVEKLASNESKTLKPMAQLFPQEKQEQALLSHSPLILAQGVASYLNTYDHYCTEQLISTTIPSILLTARSDLREVVTVAGLSKENPEIATQAQKNLQKTLGLLANRQNYRGAFGMWDHTKPSTFLTAYAVHFMLEANRHHFSIPVEMYQKGLNELANLVNQAQDDSLAALRDRAYAAYVLTLSGQVTTPSLINIQTELQQSYKTEDWQGDLVMAWLSAAYRLMQQEELADKLLQPVLERRLVVNQAKKTEIYEDRLSQDAMLLYIVARHSPHKLGEISTVLFDQIAKEISENRYNTLSSAWLIMALNAYENEAGTQGLSLQAKSGESLLKSESIGQLLSLQVGAQSLDQIEMINQSAQPAWFILSQRGYEAQVQENAQNHGIEIEREYLDKQGNPVNAVKLGDEIEAVVRLRAKHDLLSDVVVTDLIPGGFEINWQAQPENQGDRWQTDHTDIREDRLINYGTLSPQVKTLRYRLRATQQGSFAIPPAYAESMYLRHIKGHSAVKGKILVE